MSADREPSELEPGVYEGWPMARYLAAGALSAGIVRRTVNECALAGWHESHLNPDRPADDTKASDAGSIAHSILLEGSSECCVAVNPEDYRSKPTKDNPDGNTPLGWTNGAIRTARDEIRARGKIPVLKADMRTIERMVDAAWTFLQSLRTSEPAIWALFQPNGGQSELSAIWRDGDTLCKMRPDRISTDRRLIVDVKTTERSVEPDAFGRNAMPDNRISASFYRRGCRELFGTNPDYVFLALEQSAPYLCSLVGVPPAGYAIADEKVEAGIREWRRCVAANHWPAYPNRVCYIEPSPWEVDRWQEKQGLDTDGIPYNYEAMFGETA